MRIAPTRFLPFAACGLLLAGGCDGQREPSPPPPSLPVLVPPLHDLEVGEELVMEVPWGERWVWRVNSFTNETVDVLFLRHLPDGQVAQESIVWDRNEFGIESELGDGPKLLIREIARDRVNVGGRSYECWRIHAFGPQENRFFWFTDELPVHGMVKIALERKGAPDESSAAVYVRPGD